MENIQQFYWKIKAMTPNEVDRAIAERLGSDDGADYHADWQHAGRLLEMMMASEYALSSNGTITEITAFTDKGDIDFTAPTAPEAVARCWLEWWEVTHE